MKKAALVAALASALILGIGVFASRAAVRGISVYNYDGNVSLIRGGRAVWLMFDIPCEKGDLIRTSPDAFFDIECYASVGCRFGAESECLIANTLRSNIVLELRKGTALVNMKSIERGAVFQIRTPLATATVQGTQFWVRAGTDPATGKPKSTFSVRRGSILIRTERSGVTVTLPEGHSTDVDENTFAPNIRQMNDEEYKILDRVQTVLVTSPEEGA